MGKKQGVVLLGQSHERMQHVFATLLSVEPWVALADQKCSIQALFEETERCCVDRLKVTSLAREDAQSRHVIFCRWFCRRIEQFVIERLALLLQIVQLLLLNFISSLIREVLEEALIKLFDDRLELLILEDGTQFEKEEMPSCLDYQLDYLELDHVVRSKVMLQVHLDQTVVLVQEFVYQQSAHHESMLRPNYIHYAAAWQSNFHLIVDHFNGAWNELTLEELFQLSQSTGRHVLNGWRSLIQQLELSHKLSND